MRFAYLDEASISKGDRFCVVAGIIVPADFPWRRTEAAIRAVAEKHIPPELWNGMFFHAMDIWHGSRQFHRDRFSLEKRMSILEDLAAIPREMKLQVLYSFWPRTEQSADSEIPAVAFNHAMAFAGAIAAVERFMRENTLADELAMLAVENNSEHRRFLELAHEILCRQELCERLLSQQKSLLKYMPIQRIVDAPMFASKTQAVLLQLADISAFVAARWIHGRNHTAKLYEILTGDDSPPPTLGDKEWGYKMFTLTPSAVSFATPAWLVRRP